MSECMIGDCASDFGTTEVPIDMDTVVSYTSGLELLALRRPVCAQATIS